MMTRDDLIAVLHSEDGFCSIGQISRTDAAWLSRQRRAGRIVQIAWDSIWGRPRWGFAA